MNKRDARVLEIVKNYIDTLIKTDTGQPLPIGYNPIERIRNGLFHWVAVPFNGAEIYCQLRCPNATQIEGCGDLSNIVLKQDETDKKAEYNYDEIIKIRNYQEAICQLVFNIPKFDRIAEAVGNCDFVLSEKKIELERITKQFEENKGKLSEVEKDVIDKKIKALELQLGFILPDDTMAFVTRWAMGNDFSHIKTLTRENLLKAAALAKAHNKAPSEYISGVYTDFNKNEIDAYAFSILEEYQRDQKTVMSAKHKWLFGKNKNSKIDEALPERPGGG
jgi:hypothetical protein